MAFNMILNQSRSSRHSGSGSQSISRPKKSRAYLTPSQQSSSLRSLTGPAAVVGTVLKDEDLESELDITEHVVPFDQTGKRTYAKACEKLGVVPSSYCLQKLTNSKIIDVKYYGLGPKGTMAIALALVVNGKVNTLCLQGNDIDQMGMLYVQKMMCENSVIVELNLADNKLGTFGAKAIKKMLTINRVIKLLDISGNNFTDADANELAKVIQEHHALEQLNLSHNNFGDISAPLLEEMIAENGSLQDLNLSWNLFRIKGAKSIARGVKDNAYMKSFDFSWNGCDDDGASSFAKAIKGNNVLTSLDLTSTRIGPEGFLKIMQSIVTNESLLHLRLGKNNITEQAAEAGLQILKSVSVLKLETLDMSDVTFSAAFKAHVNALNDLHRHISVTYGYSESFGKHKHEDTDILQECMTVLRDYCKENGISLVELFTQFDSDDSMSVSLQEFQDGLKHAGVPLSLYKMEQFANALDKDKDGTVDYSEIVHAVMMQNQ